MATLIYDVTELQNINLDLAGDYELANDIDASATVGWNAGAGFLPIGRTAPYFTGTLDGKNHTITGLFINRPATDDVGLFGYIKGGIIKNLYLEDSDITADDYVGGLTGDTLDGAEITNVHVQGTVVGDAFVGGFAGWVGETATPDIFTRCSADVDVTGTRVGGFAYGVGSATFSQCYSIGDVESTVGFAGGFIGIAYGNNRVVTFDDCYSRGDVHAADSAGGFIAVEQVWGTGSVTLTHCYSTGAVTSDIADLGGFACGDSGATTYSDCFWDTQTSGTAVSVGGTGKTTAQMKTKTTFSGWDFSSIWSITTYCNDGYPCLLNTTPNCALIPSIQGTQVKEIIALEAMRNIEMSCMGRVYVDEEGNLTYESRYARNP